MALLFLPRLASGVDNNHAHPGVRPPSVCLRVRCRPVSVQEHKASAPAVATIRVNVVTVSDTRTPQTDEGGKLVTELCRGAQLVIAGGAILPDDQTRVHDHVAALAREGQIDAVLVTGGTGLSPRDVTIEALTPLFDRTIPGFGELFRALSFAEIGPAAMLSRATAGTIGAVVVFALPGSPAGVRLALERLILPELPHIVAQLRRRSHHEHHGPTHR
jgi:molybdenum cofactor biosynthesis protein B